MAGLVLNLKPNEKFIVNGVILQNGAKRSQIRVEDENANVLRVRDALHPDEVDTPVKRAYYIAQLMISGDLPEADGIDRLADALGQLSSVFQMGEAGERLARAREALEQNRYYSVLCQLKNLLPLERALFAYATISAKAYEQSDEARKVA